MDMISDSQSMSSVPSKVSKKSKDKIRKSTKNDVVETDDERAKKDAADKKKMKLLKNEVNRLKQICDGHEEASKKLVFDNKVLKDQIDEKEEKIQELLEKNNKMEDNLLQLQAKMMEEMGVSILDKAKEDCIEFKPAVMQPPIRRESTLLSTIKSKAFSSQDEQLEKMRLEMEEQALIDQKNASNMVAEALIAQEAAAEEMDKKLEQKNEEIREHEEENKKLGKIMEIKELELQSYRTQCDDFEDKIRLMESREIKNIKEMHDNLQLIDDLKVEIINKENKCDSKNLEIDELNKQMLQLKDKMLDFEAKLEKRQGREHLLKEDIINLKDQVQGKDTALMVLSKNLIDHSTKNENLTEMVTFFKNKIINENCLNTSFAAQKIQGKGLKPIHNNKDLIMGFVKDQSDEEEYYLEIQSKQNNKYGTKDLVRIPVEDIDEIEHVEGTLQFYVHFQSSNSSSAIGTFLQKRISMVNGTAPPKTDRSELFESKFVQKIIENFNTVLELFAQSERELNQFLGANKDQDIIPKIVKKQRKKHQTQNPPVQQQMKKPEPVYQPPIAAAAQPENLENPDDASNPDVDPEQEMEEEEYEYDEEYDEEEEVQKIGD